jgi:SOS response regulatory protein OraA/RecX
VRTVERLPQEDQEKILRIVDLLTLVPLSVQDRTQQMLRELLAAEPASKYECIAGIDDVIDYLERNVSITAEYRKSHMSGRDYPLTAKQRLS